MPNNEASQKQTPEYLRFHMDGRNYIDERAYLELRDALSRAMEANALLRQQIMQQGPKARFHDDILDLCKMGEGDDTKDITIFYHPLNKVYFVRVGKIAHFDETLSGAAFKARVES